MPNVVFVASAISAGLAPIIDANISRDLVSVPNWSSCDTSVGFARRRLHSSSAAIDRVGSGPVDAWLRNTVSPAVTAGNSSRRSASRSNEE